MLWSADTIYGQWSKQTYEEKETFNQKYKDNWQN